MEIKEDIYISKETGYEPIYDFIKQFLQLNTQAIFGADEGWPDKVAFVDDGYRVEVVENQSAKIMAFLENWSKVVFRVYVPGDNKDGAECRIIIRDEINAGGFHLRMEGGAEDEEEIVYTLDELPLVPID